MHLIEYFIWFLNKTNYAIETIFTKNLMKKSKISKYFDKFEIKTQYFLNI